MKKKNLLGALLLPISALLIAQDDMITTTLGDNEITEIMPQALPQNNLFTEENSEENDFLIEQQFICEQQAEEEGVVCQMYECINNDCKVATPIKFTNSDQSPITTVTLTEEKPVVTDSTETEEQKMKASNSTESNPLYAEEIFIPDETETIAPSETLTPEEEQAIMPGTAEINESIVTRARVLPDDEEEIEELEYQIKSAERMCERAETDPREKAICEAASARVQWKKEKIRALENSLRRR